jgi:hypothetical protein
MEPTKKLKKKSKKVRTEKDFDKLVEEQLEHYMQLHKEHEKDITYIG